MSNSNMPSAKRFDILIKGGHLIDPAAKREGHFDIAISGRKIAAIAPSIPAETAKVVHDITGQIVMPGLIDTHGHVYQHVTGVFGVNPDLVGVSSGSTTVVDMGGASPLTFQGFRHFVAEPARTRVLSFVSIYLAGGLLGHRHVGLYGPHAIDVKSTVNVALENPQIIRGIKAHAEVGGFARWGSKVIELATEAGREANIPVYVHLGRMWKDPEGQEPFDEDKVVGEVIPLMREGDILAHPFTNRQGGFVNTDGRVHPILFEAKARGIRFDVGRGTHFSFRRARIVLDAGIMPDTLGADVHGMGVNRPDDGSWDRLAFEARQAKIRARKRPIGGSASYSLLQAVNELMALGLSLSEIAPMVSSNAARMLGMEGRIGTLAEGMEADISVIEEQKGRFLYRDGEGTTLESGSRLVPRWVLRAGRWIEADSPLIPSAMEPVAA
jgi:dihydroorotase